MHKYVESTKTCAKRVSYVVDENGLDSTIVAQATTNLDQLCDVQVMIGLSCLMPMLVIVHSLIKFA